MQLGRMRIDAAVALGAAGLLIATNGPSIWLTNRIAHNGYDIEAWPFLYPFLCVGVVGVAGLARHRFQLDRARTAAIVAIAAYAAWALLSVTWSVAPSITVIRAPIAAGVAAFAVWFALELSPTRQLRAVSSAMAIAVVGSALLVHFRPLEGGGYWDGERNIYFRGIFANANSLGPVCVIGAVSFVCSAIAARRWNERGVWCLLIYLSLWLLWRSGSDTAQAAFGIVVLASIVGFLLWILHRHGAPKLPLVIATTVLVTIGIIVVAANFWKLSDVVAGDSTFGGRREIWDAALDVIPNRLWKGHGYWAYINSPTPISPVLLSNGTTHDSVLEVLLGLGIVGLVPLLLTAALAVAQVIRAVQRRLDLVALWQGAILLIVLLENVTESFVLFYSYIWMLLIASSLASSAGVGTTQTPLAEREISSSS